MSNSLTVPCACCGGPTCLSIPSRLRFVFSGVHHPAHLSCIGLGGGGGHSELRVNSFSLVPVTLTATVTEDASKSWIGIVGSFSLTIFENDGFHDGCTLDPTHYSGNLILRVSCSVSAAGPVLFADVDDQYGITNFFKGSGQYGNPIMENGFPSIASATAAPP